jgi:hypothetical protein
MKDRDREKSIDASKLQGNADDPSNGLTKKPSVRQCCRRHRAKLPLLLRITDHDNGRYTLEGPMTEVEADAWIKEVIAARRAGRNITCRVVPEAVTAREGSDRRRHWPPGSIVHPEMMSRDVGRPAEPLERGLLGAVARRRV